RPRAARPRPRCRARAKAPRSPPRWSARPRSSARARARRRPARAPGPASSLLDHERRELAGVALPARVHLVHPRRRRTSLRPCEEVLDLILFALGHDLDRAVGPVLDPASQPEALGLTHRGRAE